VHVFHFCPECGGTVFYTSPDEPDLVAVPVGVFADPSFPAPRTSYYEVRKHAWIELPDGIEGDGPWAEIAPLYEAGRYAEASDRGAALLEASPASANLAYNVACCESLAGRPGDAIAHLRLAFAASDELRERAAEDTDLDALRGEPAFTALLQQP
jgi:Glutathione-dependent formaldehyde-activating enzyme